MNSTIKALFLLLSLSCSAFANDAGILRCRGIIDPSARLACYDALAVPAADAGTVANKPAVPPDSRSAPAQSASPSPTPATSTHAPTSSAPVAAAQQKTEQFGLENRPSAVTLDAIESYIPGRFEGWDAKSTITLANGQVWQIADDSSRYMTMNDPKVRIRRGALGSFYLEFEKVNHSPRVKRVQ